MSDHLNGERPPILPAHIEETVRAIAEVHHEHRRRAGAVQRWVEAMTALLGRPAFTPVLTVVVVGWIALNIALPHLGLEAFDPPPFAYLSGIVALAALYMTGMILGTQRREDELASNREQLTLELTIVSEQKIAKLIELVEKLRADHPDVADHVDEEAAAMAESVDPQAVLDAIVSSQAADTGEHLVTVSQPG